MRVTRSHDNTPRLAPRRSIGEAATILRRTSGASVARERRPSDKSSSRKKALDGDTLLAKRAAERVRRETERKDKDKDVAARSDGSGGRDRWLRTRRWWLLLALLGGGGGWVPRCALM